MKKIISLFLTLGLFVSLAIPLSVHGIEAPTESKVYSTATINDDFETDSVMVVLKRANSVINKMWQPSDFKGISIKSIEDLTAIDSKCIQDIENYEESVDFHQILELTLQNDGKNKVLDAVSQLQQMDIVLSAEPSYYSFPQNAAIGTNDTQDQWGLQNINVKDAWTNYSPNALNVKVAVIDSGISTHADLDLNLGTGKDFVNDDGTTDDSIGHGTHVAGIIGAVGNNGIGVSGVAQRITLIPCQVATGNSNYFSMSAIVSAISYAASQNIPIINASYYSRNGYSAAEYYAIQNYPGLMVCCAGNGEGILPVGTNNDTTPCYPASYNLPNIISVADITRANTLSSSSNYGVSSVDIGAPGSGIISTASTYKYGTTTYETMSGTSMATPHVTGAAALLKSNFPSATTAQIKEAILSTAVYTPSLAGKVSTKGRLNVNDAMNYMAARLPWSMKMVDTKMAAGYSHSLIIKTDNTLWAWGSNSYGQLGNGTKTNKLKPVKIIDNVAQVACGTEYSLAIKTDGSLWAWGYNSSGQLGDGTTTNRLSPVKVMDSVVKVVCSNHQTFAIKTDGSLWAWGYNYNGQLGDGTKANNKISPVKIMDNVSQVECGTSDAVAIKTDGSLWAWGINADGELGDGTTTNKISPVKIMDDVKQAACGTYHTAAVKTDGSLWAWGSNEYGQLGTVTVPSYRTLSPVKVMDNVKKVSCGVAYTAVIKTDGSLWTWGYNNFGQIGDGTTTEKDSPVKIMDNASDFSAGYYHVLVAKTDGSLWAWGYNYNGAIGDGLTANVLTPKMIMSAGSIPTRVINVTFDTQGGSSVAPIKVNAGTIVPKPADPTKEKFSFGGWFLNDKQYNFNTAETGNIILVAKWITDGNKIAAGLDGSAAIKKGNILWTWGIYCGDGTTTNRKSPVKIMDNVVEVSAGLYCTSAIKKDNSLWAWGYNGSGQVGDGTTTARKSPVKIMDNVSAVACGNYHTAAIKTDSSLWMWGTSSNGMIDSYSPVKVMNNVKEVSCGYDYTAAIKTDGSLWAWGNNGFGQLGDGTTTDSYSPIKIMDDVKEVSCGEFHMAVIKTDGSLWVWGNNYYGQLGNGTTTESYLPVKIMDNVKAVSCGYYHTAVVKTDSILWMWGRNDSGQLGDGTKVDKSSPVKIMDNAAMIECGTYHTLAVKTDKSLWAWGYNNAGQLGDGTMTTRLTPKSIMAAGSF